MPTKVKFNFYLPKKLKAPVKTGAFIYEMNPRDFFPGILSNYFKSLTDNFLRGFLCQLKNLKPLNTAPALSS